MANQVLQPSAALEIIHLSDDYDIPFHMLATEGSVSSGSSFKLKDDTVNFFDLGIQVGMLAWNASIGASAKVLAVEVDSLDVDADIFTSAGDDYKIFSSENTGCLIYIGSSENGDITVTTQGGDKVTFKNVNQGIILPVRVLRVWLTDTSVAKLIALW